MAEEVLEETEAASIQAAIVVGQYAVDSQSHHPVSAGEHLLHLHDQHLALEGLVQDERAEMQQFDQSQV